MVMLMAEGCWTLAGQKKSRGRSEGTSVLWPIFLLFPHYLCKQIISRRQKSSKAKKWRARMPSTGLQCPRPFSLCLSYFFRLFSEAAAATLQTTNNFPFRGTWLFQILVRLHTLTLPMPCTRPPCPTETSLSQSPPLLLVCNELHPFKFKLLPPEPLFWCPQSCVCLPPYG